MSRIPVKFKKHDLVIVKKGKLDLEQMSYVGKKGRVTDDCDFPSVAFSDGKILVFSQDKLESIEDLNWGLKKAPEGLKLDADKAAFDLLSPTALLGTASVLGFGAKKYAAHNWRKGLKWSRVIGAIGRHLAAIMAGQDTDSESGLLHVDHLACEVMFLQEFYRTRKDLDDRYKPGQDENNKQGDK